MRNTMTKDRELALWRDTARRYAEIRGIIDDAYTGIKAGGLAGDIRPCIMCQEFGGPCTNCFWSEAFGECMDDDSNWKRLANVLREAQAVVREIQDSIAEQIQETAHRDDGWEILVDDIEGGYTLAKNGTVYGVFKSEEWSRGAGWRDPIIKTTHLDVLTERFQTALALKDE